MSAEHPMSAVYAAFGPAPEIRAGDVLADGGHQVHRDFVDLIVDGRPLPFRLTDPDAVSPLASDVPPAIFTTQVRGLLMETDARLEGGRHIIYGSPECEDLACGAVTAVVRRDGADYIWRDFARQTDEHADLERNGYHGLGPFRFAGAEYRAATAPCSSAGPSPRRNGPPYRPRSAAPGSTWRPSTASRPSSRSSSPRSNTPWTVARPNSTASPT
jgi:hypothetical protein